MRVRIPEGECPEVLTPKDVAMLYLMQFKEQLKQPITAEAADSVAHNKGWPQHVTTDKKLELINKHISIMVDRMFIPVETPAKKRGLL